MRVYWFWKDRDYTLDEETDLKEIEEHIYDILNKYISISSKTCVQCGNLADHFSKGYVLPYCSNCHSNEELQSMGNNFYLACTERETCEKYSGYNYELTDVPFGAYEIHIAKTSMGWLPLFQAHECFHSIKELKALYETGNFHITDEYGTEYNWDEFDERVLKFNGGRQGVLACGLWPKSGSVARQDRPQPYLSLCFHW